MVKYCEDCKHFYKMELLPVQLGLCKHEKAQMEGFGYVTRATAPKAYTERLHGNCGPDGLNYDDEEKK